MQIISRKEAIEKGLKTYFTGKPCKHGHISERRSDNSDCVECVSSRSKSWRKDNIQYKREYDRNYAKENKDHILEYKREYREENKTRINEYMKEYYQQNKEQILNVQKEYYQRNKERRIERDKEYYQQNKEQIIEYQKKYRQKNRGYINERKKTYQKKRYVTDQGYRALVICQQILHRTLRAAGSTKNTRTHEMLGYCNKQLSNSLESKFVKGMSWDNYGEWHIDHKIPVDRFVREGVEDPSVINALNNLIPMWAEHNLEKSARTLEEYLEDRPDLYDLYGHFLTQTS